MPLYRRPKRTLDPQKFRAQYEAAHRCNAAVASFIVLFLGQLLRPEPKAGVASSDTGLEVNADGTVDVYFSAKAPKGKEANWVCTPGMPNASVIPCSAKNATKSCPNVRIASFTPTARCVNPV